MLRLCQFLALLKIFYAPRAEIILENIAQRRSIPAMDARGEGDKNFWGIPKRTQDGASGEVLLVRRTFQPTGQVPHFSTASRISSISMILVGGLAWT